MTGNSPRSKKTKQHREANKAPSGDANQLDFRLRLEGFYRRLKTFLQQPVRPAAVIVIFTPLLHPGFGVWKLSPEPDSSESLGPTRLPPRDSARAGSQSGTGSRRFTAQMVALDL